jgi:adenosylcobinamide-GDP ribazoletransferase
MSEAAGPAALGFLARRRDDLILAATLLTRIPMPPVAQADSAALARAVWAYPLIGALVGVIGAVVFGAAKVAGLPGMSAAWLAIAATILATGCFHEDGLADFWDGIGGGQTIERKLEIMRDSRIGSYGAAALIVSLGARTSLLAALDEDGLAGAGLIIAGLIGRSAIAGVLWRLPAARTDGLAATASTPPAWSVGVAVGMAGIAFTLAPAVAVGGALIAAALATAWMIGLMRRQIAGYTGDGLGASEQTVEIAVLVALAAAMGLGAG